MTIHPHSKVRDFITTYESEEAIRKDRASFIKDVKEALFMVFGEKLDTIMGLPVKQVRLTVEHLEILKSLQKLINGDKMHGFNLMLSITDVDAVPAYNDVKYKLESFGLNEEDTFDKFVERFIRETQEHLVTRFFKIFIV